MNSNGLARLYDRLSPQERLPLILAASRRGDEVERERLARSAPRVAFRVPDYFGLAQAFTEVGSLHLMELLELAALYFQSLGLADSMQGERAARVLDTAMLFGYLLKVKLGGWRAFCAELRLDPELCWSCLPGFDTVQRAAALAETASFTAEGAEAYLRRTGKENPVVATPDAVSAALRECFKRRAD